MKEGRTMIERFIETMRHRGFDIKPMTEVTDVEILDFRTRMT